MEFNRNIGPSKLENDARMDDKLKDEMKTRVWQCLVRSVPADLSLQNVSDDTHLFDEAVLDSFSTVAMFSEIEREFRIKLKEDDVFSPSFATLRGIAELIEPRSGA
jgi:acyl carrier protein